MDLCNDCLELIKQLAVPYNCTGGLWALENLPILVKTEKCSLCRAIHENLHRRTLQLFTEVKTRERVSVHCSTSTMRREKGLFSKVDMYLPVAGMRDRVALGLDVWAHEGKTCQYR